MKLAEALRERKQLQIKMGTLRQKLRKLCKVRNFSKRPSEA